MSLIATLIEDLIRWPGGPLGIRLRRAWYRRRLRACGSGLRIEPGVHILGARHIGLGDNVWLDRGVTLIAGPSRAGARIVAGPPADGTLEIGADSHLGPGAIVQAHGGVRIGAAFTASAGARIYSFSNDPAACRSGTMPGTDPGYRVTPVEIGRNVWLGLDALVIGGRIGDDAFVRPRSVVTGALPAGQVAAGDPARPIRPRFPEAPG
jgi:acetyltransferase-like isoleucine patch superfamily enzyme